MTPPTRKPAPPKPPIDLSGMNDEQLRLHIRVLASASAAADRKSQRAEARSADAWAALTRAEAEQKRRMTTTAVWPSSHAPGARGGSATGEP